MAIDPYSPCPCGTGKKVKFCCPDLVHELNEIQNMLEGGQRQACLDYIESVEKKHPNKACLVTTRALLESALGNEKKAEQTLEGYLAKDPTNPVALAELAVVYAAQRGATAGIEPLEKALDFDTDVVSGRVVMSIARLGEMLLMDGQVLAARGHFMLAYILYPQDEGTLQLLARFFGSPQIPLALKNEQALDPAPAGVAWKTEFDAAITEARRGRWWKAADALKKVATQAPNDPTLWHDLAVLRSWLADLPGTVAALRKYASLDVPFDDAVEAEALAQLIDINAPVDAIDELKVTFNVEEFDKVSETLAGDKHATPFAWQSLGLDFGDQPPPQAGYFLLDRPIPATGKDIARHDIPHIVGRLLLFGRQTDRPARIEATVRRTQLTQLEEGLKNLVGDQAKRTGEPEVVDSIPVAEAALSWSWRLPEDATQEHVRKLVEEQRRDAILNGWIATKLKILGDKSPQEVAGDPTQTIRLAATVSLVEQSFAQPSTEEIFDELRAKLHLPAAGPIEPKPDDPIGVPYTRAHRLDVSKLTDEDLVRNFQRALQVVARTAVRKLGLAIVERPSLKGKVDLAGVFANLADIEGLSDDAVKFLGLAKQAAAEQKQSCAQLDLEELQLRLRRGEAAEFGRLIDHIQQHHVREPGIGRALMQILYEAGIVGPDGRPRGGMPGGGGAGATINGVSVGGDAPAAEESGKLWTPGGEAAPAQGGGKSGLWVPGMD